MAQCGKHRLAGQGREVRPEVPGEATGCPWERQRTYHEDEQHHEQEWHGNLRYALDALLNAACHHHTDHDEDQRYVAQDRQWFGNEGVECCLDLVGWNAAEPAGDDLDEVRDDPAQDHGIVGEDHHVHDSAEPSDDVPRMGRAAGELCHPGDGRELGFPPEADLGGEEWDPDENGARYVDDQERAAAVLAHHVREPPDVAEADGEPHRGHDESETASPRFAHHLPLFKRRSSSFGPITNITSSCRNV